MVGTLGATSVGTGAVAGGSSGVVTVAGETGSPTDSGAGDQPGSSGERPGTVNASGAAADTKGDPSFPCVST
jgi:hypothetical protein